MRRFLALVFESGPGKAIIISLFGPTEDSDSNKFSKNLVTNSIVVLVRAFPCSPDSYFKRTCFDAVLKLIPKHNVNNIVLHSPVLLLMLITINNRFRTLLNRTVTRKRNPRNNVPLQDNNSYFTFNVRTCVYSKILSVYPRVF